MIWRSESKHKKVKSDFFQMLLTLQRVLWYDTDYGRLQELLCSGAICGCRVSNRKYLLILTSVSEQ